MMLFFLRCLCLFLLICFLGAVQAQENLTDSSIATVTLKQVGFFGRGVITNAVWQPDNGLIIQSDKGLWRYNALDLTQPPQHETTPFSQHELAMRYSEPVLELPPEIPPGITRLSADGGYLAVVNWDSEQPGMRENETIFIYDTRTWQQISAYPSSYPTWITEFSPDNQTLIAFPYNLFGMTAAPDAHLQIIDVATGTLLFAIPDHFWRNTTAVAFSPDSQYFIVVRADGTLTKFETATGKSLVSEAGYPGYADEAYFTRDGKTLIAGNNEAIYVWDVATRTRLKQLPGCNVFALHPDDVTLACLVFTLFTRSLSLVNTETGTVRFLDERVYFDGTQKLLFSPDGRWLVVAWIEGDAIVYNVQTGQISQQLYHDAGIKTNYGFGIAFTPDNQYMAVAEPGSIWHVATGEVAVTMALELAWSTNVAFSPDGALYAAATTDGIFVWRMRDLLATGNATADNAIFHIPLEQSESVEAPIPSYTWLAFHPANPWLAVNNQGIELWDLITSTRIATTPDLFSFGIAFSPNGKHIITRAGSCIACGSADESFHLGGVYLWEIKLE